VKINYKVTKKPSPTDTVPVRRTVGIPGKPLTKAKSTKDKSYKTDLKQLKSNTLFEPLSPEFEIEGKRVEIDLLDDQYHAQNAAQLNSPELESCMKRINGKQKEPKAVTFAQKLIVNEDSLDSDMIDRMKHNLEYNDDRIFENLSIFQQDDAEEESKIEAVQEQAQPRNENESNRD
jgi:hypothetical protein